MFTQIDHFALEGSAICALCALCQFFSPAREMGVGVSWWLWATSLLPMTISVGLICHAGSTTVGIQVRSSRPR